MVCHFRAADPTVGGQGASLAPVFHPTIVQRLDFQPPIAVLNVGVVTNVTFIDGEDLIEPGWRTDDRSIRSRRKPSPISPYGASVAYRITLRGTASAHRRHADETPRWPDIND